MRLDDTTWYDPATLRPLAHRSHAAVRRFSLDYGSGSVHGSVEDSTGSHPFEVAVADVFDPSALHPILRSLTIERATYLIPRFNHETRSVREDSLLVEGEEELATDHGPVPVWRIVVVSGGQRATYYVRRSDGVELKAVVRFGDNEMTIAHPGVK